MEPWGGKADSGSTTSGPRPTPPRRAGDGSSPGARPPLLRKQPSASPRPLIGPKTCGVRRVCLVPLGGSDPGWGWAAGCRDPGGDR